MFRRDRKSRIIIWFGQLEYQTHLDPLQINGVHDGPLKELHGGEVPFE